VKLTLEWLLSGTGDGPAMAGNVSSQPRQKAALGPAAWPAATSIRGKEYGPAKEHRCWPST